MDRSGDVVTFNGTSWSSSEAFDATRAIEGISCPTTTFCMAVDGSGYVLDSTPDTTVSQLAWDTAGSLPLVLSDGTNDYLYGPQDTPVESITLSSSTPLFLSYDATDDTWTAASASGTSTSFWGYDAYGSLAFGTPPTGFPFGYAGQYADEVSGLSDMRARWYEAGTGEFTTVDPAVSNTDQPYEYAGDDPVNESDPTGLYSCGSKPAGFIVNRYSRGSANYTLVCGTAAYGIRHIQGRGHFAGDVTNVVRNQLIRVTIARGRSK